jgi:hypothetical protein
MNQGIYSIGNAAIASVPYGVNGVTAPTSVRVLVVGGGGSGGSGGATATIGAGAGGGAVVEQTVTIALNSAISVTVGAGGAGSVTNGIRSSFGVASKFDSVTAIGGGSGGIQDSNGTFASYVRSGGNGANGGGRSYLVGSFDVAGASVTGSGFAGRVGDGFNPGGGGGSGGLGTTGGLGGAGKVSTITGLTYGGGGGGGRSGSAGGTGGGGSGGASGVAAVAGTANTGGGGGGAFAASTATGTGGSGVVVIRCSSGLNIRLGIGLTYTVSTISGDRLITITAGTDTVTFF